MAIIQEWQPRLNYPFICQFFHPKRGILKKPSLNTNAQFGLATLWRRTKHKFTPTLVRQILTSERFQNRLELWTIIHALGSNTEARFEQTKMLRSNDGGLTLCYALGRIQEPFRTLSLNAIDASIKWWQGKPAPRATALRAPWSLTPNLQQQLKHFLRKWHLLQDGLHQTRGCSGPTLQPQAGHRGLVHHTTCNVLLHKVGTFQSRGSQSIRPSLGLSRFTTSLTRIRGVSGHCRRLLVEQGLSFQKGIPKPAQTWATRLDKAKRPIPNSEISDFSQHLWTEHSKHVTCHITKPSINSFQKTFGGCYLPCEDKQASSLRIYCPCLYYYQAIEKLFRIPPFSNRSPRILNPSSHLLSIFYIDNMENPTLGR